MAAQLRLARGPREGPARGVGALREAEPHEARRVEDAEGARRREGRERGEGAHHGERHEHQRGQGHEERRPVRAVPSYQGQVAHQVAHDHLVDQGRRAGLGHDEGLHGGAVRLLAISLAISLSLSLSRAHAENMSS